MNKSNFFLYRLFFMWMLIFLLARLAFVIMLFTVTSHSDYSEWPYTFIYGIRLDLSTTAYLLILPTLLTIFYLLSKKHLLLQIQHLINNLLLFLICILLISNLAIYQVWGTIINARAIDFLQDAEGILASLSTVQIITRILLLASCNLFLRFAYIKIIKIKQTEISHTKALLPTILLAALLPILLRGGLQEIPINESASSFSEVTQMNDAATNPVWYLFNNLSKRGVNRKNPYLFFSEEKANEDFSSFFKVKKESPFLLKNRRPNIILVVLESWTADIIKPLGGEENITPYFTSLCDSGLLFSGIYSSGRRTDQMIPSVLSGFPSLPNHSVSRFSDKIRKLPMLSQDIKAAGYSTSFYYGGELGFANMKSYLLEGKFQKIIGKDEFSDSQMNSKWGAHDQYVFSKMLDDLSGKKEPFFTMLLTLSSHEPFEVPGEQVFPGTTEPEKFRNAAHYTDKCIKNFIQEAMKQSWYNNTLFIFVADHGHLLPKQRDYFDPACYHIPLLWFGNVIADSLRGTVVSHPGGQHEIAATLLKQLSLPNQQYLFSRNLLSQYEKTGIYLNYDKAIGWLQDGDQFVYLLSEKKTIKEFTHFQNPADSSNMNYGKVFLQKLYSSFLKL